MPERIWAGWMSTSERDSVPVWSEIDWLDEIEYVRIDVHEAAVAAEREACAQIAQRLADTHLRKMDGKYAGDPEYHYNEGVTYAGEIIADEITARGNSRQEDGGESSHPAGR